MNQPLIDLLAFNHWANQRIFDVCRGLSDQELDTRISGTAGSIRELLTHIAASQHALVGRAHGEQRSAQGVWSGFDDLSATLKSGNDALVSLATTLGDDPEIEIEREGKLYRFRRSFYVTSAGWHGAEHRTEIRLTLASLGITTPNLESRAYAVATGRAKER
jgi:uncharacterized damage-inducible protein DinB